MKKLLVILVLGLLLGTQILAADDVYYCLDDQAIGFSGQEKSYGEVKHYEPQKFKFKLIENTKEPWSAKVIMTEKGENTEYKSTVYDADAIRCTYSVGDIFVFNKEENKYSRADIHTFAWGWKYMGDMWMSYGTCGKY